VYGLFVVPIVTGFFSVLGMAIERFQVSEKNNDDIHNRPCTPPTFKHLARLEALMHVPLFPKILVIQTSEK
jgi:hypothetical protein